MGVFYNLDAIDESGNPTVVRVNSTVVIGTQTIENPSVEWISFDKTIINVDNGVVQAIKAGQAFVTTIYEDTDACTFEGSVYFDIRLVKREYRLKR